VERCQCGDTFGMRAFAAAFYGIPETVHGKFYTFGNKVK